MLKLWYIGIRQHMSSTTKNINSKKDYISYYIVATFVALLPYDMYYSTLAIYGIAAWALINISKQSIARIPKVSVLFSGIILLSISGYFYSQDIGKAAYLLERQLAFIIFPIVLPLASPINNTLKDTVFKVFAISLSIAVLYLMYHSIHFIAVHQLTLSALEWERFYHRFFTQKLDIHPIYLSLYLALSILYLLSRFGQQKLLVKIFWILLLIIHFCGLYFCSSRNTIISLLLILIFIAPFFLRHRKKLVLSLSLLLLGIGIALGIKDDYVKQRFTRDLLGDVQSTSANAKLFPESRIVRWKIAYELIQQKPIWGYGTGDEIPLLVDQYAKRKMWESYFSQFNTHNQYLALLLKHGIVGLIFILLCFGYYLYLAIKSKSFLYLAFLILILLGAFTENLFDANKGIFYIAFFNVLLGYLALQKEPLNLIKTSTVTQE